MNFFFGSLFWGILLVLLGLSMVVRAVFNIDIPIFRFIFAAILIYFGAKLLLNRSENKTSEKLFDQVQISEIKSDKNYNTIFGHSQIDLQNCDLENSSLKVDVDVIFGSADILINPDIPARIKISTVFAEGKIPAGSVGAFSDHIYETPAFSTEKNALFVNIDVIFGAVDIRN